MILLFVPGVAAFELVEQAAWAVPDGASALFVNDGHVGVVGATEAWEYPPVDGTVGTTATGVRRSSSSARTR